MFEKSRSSKFSNFKLELSELTSSNKYKKKKSHIFVYLIRGEIKLQEKSVIFYTRK